MCSSYEIFKEFQSCFKDKEGENINCFPFFDKNTIINLCENTIEILKKQETLLKLNGNFIIVGDLHGNIRDLIRIFQTVGFPPQTNFLFLGDYVDRGSFSLEIIILLFSLICIYPENIFLLRGNHEFPEINEKYGFKDQILEEYNDENLWNLFNNVFTYLSLACILNNEIFCVHGGITPELTKISQILDINKPILSNNDSLILGLMWADPSKEALDYIKSNRGCGFNFGYEAINKFLLNNKLLRIIRAHQCVCQGISKFIDDKCITIFSSSNYDIQIPNNCGFLQIFLNNSIKAFNLQGLKNLDRKDAIFIKIKQILPENLNSLKFFNLNQQKRIKIANFLSQNNFKKNSSNTQIVFNIKKDISFQNKIISTSSSICFKDQNLNLPNLK